MFKCYRQLEHSDCGLTCIRMIARHYGKRIPLRYLQKITDLNRLGMSIKDITGCCSKIGMYSQAVKLGMDYADRMPLPAILYWQQRHFVVLYKVDCKRGKYYVADPAQGKMVYSRANFVKHWIPESDNSGLAVLMEPEDEFYEKQYERDNAFRQFVLYLLDYAHGYKRNFFVAAMITLLIMVADFSVPLLLRKTIDEGIGLKDVGLIISLLLSQLAIAIGGMVSSGCMEIVLNKAGLGINM